MTHATIYKSSLNGEILGFKTEGHANFAKKGSDIVCASIDLYTIDKYETQVNEDLALIEFKLNPFVSEIHVSNEARVLLNALELGLSQIAAGNPKHLSITIEEV